MLELPQGQPDLTCPHLLAEARGRIFGLLPSLQEFLSWEMFGSRFRLPLKGQWEGKDFTKTELYVSH